METAPSSNKRRQLRLVRPGEGQSPVPRAGRVNPLWLWFGVLGGPVAFGLERLIGSLLVISRCVRPAAGSALPSLTSAQQIMSLITIVAAIIAAAAGIASWRAWRQLRRQAEEESGESLSSAPFWALGGLFLSTVFFFFIVLTGALAVVLSSTCVS